MARTVLWLACSGATATATCQVLAQGAAPANVTATRTALPPFDAPASVDVIDGEHLRADGRQQFNLSEGLALVPGLQIRDRQNQAQDLQLSIRGAGARSNVGVRGVRLYVDGIPATMPDGQGQLSHIDIGSAARVETLRGPFSALYGNSSGGVVQVFTEQGSGPLVVTPSVASGSDGFYREGIKAQGSVGGFGYSLDTSHFKTDGFRAHSAAERDHANVRLDMALQGGQTFTLVANRLDSNAQDALGLSRAQFEQSPRSTDPSAELFNTRKSVRQTQLGLVFVQPLGGGDQLQAMVYGGERMTVQYEAIPVALQQASILHPGGVIGLMRNYGGADLRWTAQTSLAARPLAFVAGLSYDTLREERMGLRNFAGARLGVAGAVRRYETNRVNSLDPYTQASWALGPHWTVNAGVRRSTVKFDSVDHFIVGANGNDSGSTRYSASLPVAGLVYAPTEDLRWHASVGKGFDTPTLNEVAYRASGGAGLNLGLRPSRSDNVEAGVKWRTPAGASPRIDWSAALFQSSTQDEIVTQSDANGRSTFQNAGASRRRGLEFASTASLPGSWLAQLSYTWLDAKYRDSFLTCTAFPCAIPGVLVPAGNRIPGIARTSVGAELGLRPRTGWRGGVEARYLSSVAVNDLNSDAAASFFTAGANLGYVLKAGNWRWTGTARVDNLLDRKYVGSVIVNERNGRYLDPAAGRTWTVSLAGSYLF